MSEQIETGDRVRAVAVAALLGLSASCFIAARVWPADHVPVDVAAANADVASLADDTPALGHRTATIESIHVGDRVLAFNPLGTEDPAFVEPDPATWRHVVMRHRHDDGRVTIVSLLRPPDWLADHGIAVHAFIDLHLPELGVDGRCYVVAINPCPRIEPGEGSVVTGTFIHKLPKGESILEVAIEGSGTPITATGNHPFFSPSRQAFMPLEQFAAGDTLRTADGQLLRITHITPRGPPAGTKVYNLEVAGEHVYHVGAAGVLVHNKAMAAGNSSGRRFWTRTTEFRGNRVYQRDDLIDLWRLDPDGTTNLGRMLDGRPPYGPDGDSMHLHHMLQTNDGPIAEVTQAFHQQNTRIIHINTRDIPSGIDRAAFNQWREAYWKQRARDLIGVSP